MWIEWLKKVTSPKPHLPEVNFSDYGDVRYLHLGTLLGAGFNVDRRAGTPLNWNMYSMMAGYCFRASRHT
jgi:hypothetical protein